MTESELRAKYVQAIRIIRQERKMREWVFRNDPVKLNAKLVEIDMLERIVTELKDFAKLHVEQEQPRLLDVPRKAGYE